ncbi:hypothetical protein [Blastococcus sp. SYSU DS0619]
MGTTKQSAWEAHNRWIDEQARLHEENDYEGLDAGEAVRARALAGSADETAGA